MRAELPALSFICASLLAVLLMVPRVRANVSSLSIVAWLLGCNIVQGLNAIIWSDNVDIQVPVWCDIVTKLLLGASVGLPCALVCAAWQLENLASSRDISSDSRVQGRRKLIEMAICYIPPLIFISLHIIVQDHRFDLVKDLGCSASIHPSTPALVIVWLPPLITCFIAFVICGFAISHTSRVSSARFACHLESRSSMTSSLFSRQLAMTLIISGVLTIISLFTMFSPPVFKPWSSWSAVHVALSQVDIITLPTEIKGIQLTWWGIPVVSIVHILLSFSVGEEIRDILNFIQKTLISLSRPSLSSQIPKQPEMILRSASLSTPQPRPQTIDLKSGWDDMLESKSPKRILPRIITKSTSPSPSRTPSPTSSSDAGDEIFKASTLSYLVSPAAQSLGLSSPSTPAQITPASTSPTSTSPTLSFPSSIDPIAVPRTVASLSPMSHSLLPTRPRQPIPDDAASTISSLWNAPWPEPPKTVPISVTPRKGANSRSHSPASSSEHTIGYPLLPSVTPPYLQSRPFQGSNVAPLPDMPVVTLPQKLVPKRPSVRGLHRNWSREKLSTPQHSGEIIYMTVVKETV